MRTDLCVPFEKKEEAYRLGARWDDARKTWYCPDGTDLYPLMKFLPELKLDPKVEAALRRGRGYGASTPKEKSKNRKHKRKRR